MTKIELILVSYSIEIYTVNAVKRCEEEENYSRPQLKTLVESNPLTAARVTSLGKIHKIDKAPSHLQLARCSISTNLRD